MRTSLSLLVALLVVLGGCSEDTKSNNGKKNNGTTAGTDGAGVGAGISGSSTAGISGGGQIAGMSGGVAGTTGLLPDGGMCEVGKFCAPTGPDPENCGTLELKGDVKTVKMPGNVLMVFDRSGSMSMQWNGQPRWQAAGSAMINALMPLQDDLTIGAVFFPDNQFISCNVVPIDNADQIQFMPGAMALAKMQAAAPSGTPTPLYAATVGQTPTLQGLQVADAAITASTLTGTTVVILVTDGDPNCMWNEATAIGIVSGWAMKGIKTYALGVPGVGGAGEATLNAVAVAGGTMSYISPSDPATLGMKIREIVESTVSVGIDSCEINFDPPADVPEKLTLAVTDMGVEQAVPHKYPDGTEAWEITADGKTATLKGDLCKAAKAGIYESLRFVFGCEDLPPAPPPDIPE